MAAFSKHERYTPEDVEEVVEHAKLLGIRVLVEVDTPGHTMSWCTSHPEACPTPSCGATTALSPASNATFVLIEGVLSDLVAATEDNVLHLGGDEVQYSCWNNSAAVRAWIARQPWAAPYAAKGKDGKIDWSQPCSNPGWPGKGPAAGPGAATCIFDNVFQEFIRKTHAIAAKLGKTATGWHEIWRHLGTTLPASTIVHFWLGGGEGLNDMAAATAHGYKAIWSIDRGVGVGGWYTDSIDTVWEHMYIRDPCEGLVESQCKNVLGGGAEQWGEMVDASDYQSTLWPRAAAIAERLWSPRPSNDSATGPAPGWCTREASPGANGYACINNTAAVLPRLQNFRCMLNRRGVAAAPLRNKEARTSPGGPGSCYEQ